MKARAELLVHQFPSATRRRLLLGAVAAGHLHRPECLVESPQAESYRSLHKASACTDAVDTHRKRGRALPGLLLLLSIPGRQHIAQHMLVPNKHGASE